MSDGLKGAIVVVFVIVVMAAAFSVFRLRSSAQQRAILQGVSSPPLPSSWDTGDVQDTTDAGGAHH